MYNITIFFACEYVLWFTFYGVWPNIIYDKTACFSKTNDVFQKNGFLASTPFAFDTSLLCLSQSFFLTRLLCLYPFLFVFDPRRRRTNELF